ncbi:hypothetical protein HDV00_012541, partial [Rhizophlyctis rosea]
MGLMQGKVQGDTMIVMDAFAPQVEGTETRVNSAQGGYKYIVRHMEKAKEVRADTPSIWVPAIGIDVATQMLIQKYQEPWLAVVEIGAFRTHPEVDDAPSEHHTIPLSKIEDFGVHANSYSQLDFSFFKSFPESKFAQTSMAQVLGQHVVVLVARDGKIVQQIDSYITTR